MSSFNVTPGSATTGALSPAIIDRGQLGRCSHKQRISIRHDAPAPNELIRSTCPLWHVNPVVLLPHDAMRVRNV